MGSSILYLNGNGEQIPIKIEKDRRLNSKIYWSFTNVYTGNDINSDNLHHSLQSNFIGSDHYFGDEGFVFNDEKLTLSDIFLSVPEENFDGEQLLKKILNQTPIKGLPFLLNSQRFNSISSSDYRYLDPNCSHLISISKEAINKNDFLRISIHNRLDLLFQNDLHCEFVLHNPVRSMVRFDGDFIHADLDIDVSFLYESVYIFFKFMTLSNWDKLESKDEEIKEILISIITNLQNTNTSIEPAYALNRHCKLLLLDYYGLEYEL